MVNSSVITSGLGFILHEFTSKYVKVFEYIVSRLFSDNEGRVVVKSGRRYRSPFTIKWVDISQVCVVGHCVCV